MKGSVTYPYHNTTNRIHPVKFAMWIALASITMMFGAFTSAFIVRKAAGNWLVFELPSVFYLSTIILLVSSITLHSSYKSFLKENWRAYKLLLTVSLILGVLFVGLQYVGWNELFAIGVDLKGNPSGSFLYVLTGVHALHVIGGIAALIVAMINAFSLKQKVTNRRKLNFEITLHYWHFVDLLWVYLLVFLILSI